MPWRKLLRSLTNNEQLIQKIQDSEVVRKAARMTVYFMHKTKEAGEDSLDKVKKSDAMRNITQHDRLQQAQGNLQSFKNTFKKELHDGIKDFNEQKKKRLR